MAAKKSIPKEPGSHRRRANDRRRPRTASGGATGARRRAPVADCEPAAQLAIRLRKPDDVVECLSNCLALIETIALALREFEADPGVGTICTALEQTVEMVGRAHAAVNLYLQRTQA